MPRPVRCRRIGQMPAFRSFSPDDAPDAEVICLTLDEYETLRLMDAEGLNQEACAAQMNVARTTVTAIYESARHKIATALVQGKRLQITGGCCEFEPVPPPEHLITKGSQNMRIAIPYKQGEIFQHFGHTEQFKLYDVENGTIVREQIVDTNGSGHGALAETGIRLYAGVTGSADAAAKALAAGSLEYDPDARCAHHDHHHGEGHDCHSHRCGEHSCHKA